MDTCPIDDTSHRDPAGYLSVGVAKQSHSYRQTFCWLLAESDMVVPLPMIHTASVRGHVPSSA